MSESDSHEHGPNCGHEELEHGDHVGYLKDGFLHCKVPAASTPNSNTMKPRFILVQHSLDHMVRPCEPSVRPCHTFKTGDQLDSDKGFHHEHHHDHHDHQHDSDCGHPRVAHADHFDYLVDDELHHVHDGHCDNHGTVRRRKMGCAEYDLLSSSPTMVEDKETKRMEPRFRRRREMESMGTTNNSGAPRDRVVSRSQLAWYQDRDSLRFFTMFFLTGGYMVIEFVIGLMIGSLALIADAVHMLSDFIALVVGFYALQVSKKQATVRATYGWTRMEVVGGLINGTFLLALSLSIVLEAITRFINPANETLENNPTLLLIVAGVGLGVNLFGMLLFGHGHSHSGHSHSSHGHGHGPSESDGDGDGDDRSPGHSHDHDQPDSNRCDQSHDHDQGDSKEQYHSHDHHHSHDHAHPHGHGPHAQPSVAKKQQKSAAGHIENLNIRGVFLHVMGDALGSVAVIVSGLVILYSDSPDRVLADPICSLLITLMIILSGVPLLKQSTRVLLQQVPDAVDLESLRSELMRVAGVKEIHELHVWQLNTTKFVASCHAIVCVGNDFMVVSDAMKFIFHSYGVHSTTIQPEYLVEDPQHNDQHEPVQRVEMCHEPICPAENCTRNACCEIRLPSSSVVAGSVELAVSSH